MPNFPTQNQVKESDKNMGIETWPPYRVFEVTKALDIQGLAMLLG